MKRSYLISIIIIFLLTLCYFLVYGTPYYTLHKIKSDIQKGNPHSLYKFVDIKKIEKTILSTYRDRSNRTKISPINSNKLVSQLDSSIKILIYPKVIKHLTNQFAKTINPNLPPVNSLYARLPSKILKSINFSVISIRPDNYLLFLYNDYRIIMGVYPNQIAGYITIEPEGWRLTSLFFPDT